MENGFLHILSELYIEWYVETALCVIHSRTQTDPLFSEKQLKSAEIPQGFKLNPLSLSLALIQTTDQLDF